jgi:DNA-binding MarR family transcriptional regulator
MLNRAITRIYDDALRPHGMTTGQLNVLTSIAVRQPVPAGKLARLLSMEISTLSRNARLLQQDGLIEIDQAERGNGRILSVTDAGAEKLARLRPAWCVAQRHAHELLGNEASEAIRALVDPTFAEQHTG